MVRTIRRGTENDQGQQRHQDQNPTGPSAPTPRSLPDFEDLFLVVLHTTMKSLLVVAQVHGLSGGDRLLDRADDLRDHGLRLGAQVGWASLLAEGGPFRRGDLAASQLAGLGCPGLGCEWPFDG